MKKIYLFFSLILLSYHLLNFSMDNTIAASSEDVLSRILLRPEKYYQRLIHNLNYVLVCKAWKNYIVKEINKKGKPKSKLEYRKAYALFQAVEDNASTDEIIALIKNIEANMHYAMGYFPNYPIISCWRSVIQKKDLRILQCFIDNGADLNTQDEDPDYVGMPRETGLILAAKTGWSEGVKLLLIAGADRNIIHENVTAYTCTNDPEIKRLFDSNQQDSQT